MNFDTTRWSCYRWRYAVNSAKHFLGKIFFIIWVFIGEIILQLYLSWCQITHLTKNETQPKGAKSTRNGGKNQSLGKSLLDPPKNCKALVKFFFLALSHIYRKCSLQKIWIKTAISALSGQNNLQAPI